MTGEQKPGGLEPYGWIYETFAPGAGWCAGPEWWPAKFTRTPPNPKTTRNVIALYTAAEAKPAEARIRELMAQLVQSATIEGEAHRLRLAAEAKLARAVEGLEAINAHRIGRNPPNVWTGSDICRRIATETLAALQREKTE